MSVKTTIIRLALPVLLSMAALLSGCGGAASSAEQLDRASRSVEQGEYRDAEVRLKSLLQKDGDNAQAWLLLGRVSLARYRYADAIQQFKRARDSGAHTNKTAQPLAEALVADNQYQRALDTLADVNTSDGTQRAQVSVLRGKAHLGLEQVDEARAAFDNALEAVPDYAGALVGKAHIAGAADDVARARTLLDRATQSQPEYAPAWLASGRLAYADNNCDAAAPAFEKFLSLNGTGSPEQLFRARSYLADCEMRAGEMAKAKHNVDILMQQAPDSAFANYLQALVDIRAGDHEQAARHLQRVLSRSPNSVRSLTLLASIKLQQDDTSNAEAYLNQAIAQAPANVPALRLLASLYVQREETDRAVRMLENAYAKNPDSNDIRVLLAQVMASRGDDGNAATGAGDISALVANDAALKLDVAAAMARAGNTAAAVALIDGLEPNNARDRLRASAIRIGVDLRDRRPERAVATARKLVADAPDDPERLRLLARTYAGTQSHEKAAETLDRALQITPEDTELLLARASAFARAGEYDAARDMLERVLALLPSDLRAQLAMAQISAAQDDQAKALSWLEQAQASHPQNTHLSVRLIQAYLAAQNTTQALKLAEERVADDPDNALLNRIQGIALLASGQNDAAIDQLEKAANLAPDEPAYRLDLAQAQISTEQYEDALKQLQRLRGDHPTFLPAVSVLARVQAQRGNGEAALKKIKTIPVDADNRASINTLKGRIFAALGDYEQAVDAYASAYQAQPARSLAVALFDARRRAGLETPEASLVDWLGRTPDDTAITLMLAQWYQASGQTGAAQRSYRKLLSADKDNAAALNNLALIRSEQGHDDALDYAHRAHEAAPGSAAIADTLGWLLVNGGNMDRGMPLLEQAAGDMPDNPGIQYHLASGLAATDSQANRSRARDILERILSDDASFSERESAQALRARLEQNRPGA